MPRSRVPSDQVDDCSRVGALVTFGQHFLRRATARWQRGALCFHDTTRVERPLARFAVVVERWAMATGVLRRRSLVVQRHRMGSPRSCVATLDAPDRSPGALRRSRRLDDRVRQRGGGPRSRLPVEARPGLGKFPRLHGVGAMAGRHRSPASRTYPTGAGSAGTETITGSGLRSIALICRDDLQSCCLRSSICRVWISASRLMRVPASPTRPAPAQRPLRRHADRRR